MIMFSIVLLALATGASRPTPRLHLTLAFDQRVAASTQAAVVEEAARVWAPYGVALQSPADLVSTTGLDDSHWPIAYRHQLVARVLGRALTHEIGHYLLHTRGHSKSGLMQATHRIDELMGLHDRNLALSCSDLALLCEVLLRAAGAAPHGVVRPI